MEQGKTKTRFMKEEYGDHDLPSYVLITPARNEISTIERTISSVIRQTQLPLRWVIVSDGSTDGTDEVVARYAAAHAWIELLKMPHRKERTFAGKATAFNAGYNHVKALPFEIVGNLDADISFSDDFFKSLLVKFAENPSLGVGGGQFREKDASYDFRFSSVEHVSGPCQIFRRRCFEEIGGYVPVKGGGIDVISVLSARMRGWQTRTFTELIYEHHRSMGTAGGSVLKSRYRDGVKDYSLGTHPLWEGFRVVYQASAKPVIIGACALSLGYLWSAVRHVRRPVSRELVMFRRKDQMLRLRTFLGDLIRGQVIRPRKTNYNRK